MNADEVNADIDLAATHAGQAAAGQLMREAANLPDEQRAAIENLCPTVEHTTQMQFASGAHWMLLYLAGKADLPLPESTAAATARRRMRRPRQC